MARSFVDLPAVRERVPLLLGLAGPSGGGKTFSALRLATGMQRVTGGEIYCIDTESRRALHYAEQFRFRHVPFGPPFSPLDYLAAIEHCVGKGASILIIDSMSHEHEGPGGVLEWHDREAERLSNLWGVKPGVTQIPAWAAPKAARRRLINSILHLGASAILCFRAKEKIGIKKSAQDPGDRVIDMGWTPIAGEEFKYEQVLQCLLLPGCDGVPTWDAKRPAEKAMTKLPDQFRALFAERQPLSEAIGEALARWAEGDVAGAGAAPEVGLSAGNGSPPATPGPAPDSELEPSYALSAVLQAISHAETKESVRRIAEQHKGDAWSEEERGEIKRAIDRRAEALKR